MSAGAQPSVLDPKHLIDEALTEQIIGAAIEVHRHLGPGLLESAYEECLCHELQLRGLSFDERHCAESTMTSPAVLGVSVSPW